MSLTANFKTVRTTEIHSKILPKKEKKEKRRIRKKRGRRKAIEEDTWHKSLASTYSHTSMFTCPHACTHVKVSKLSSMYSWPPSVSWGLYAQKRR